MNYYLLRPSQDGETSTGRKVHCSSSIILDCPGNSFVEKKKRVTIYTNIDWLTFINTSLLQVSVKKANKLKKVTVASQTAHNKILLHKYTYFIQY